MQPKDIQALEGIHQLLNEIWIIFVPIIILMLGKEIIIKWIDGLLWRWKSPYEERDIIQIDGKLAKIVHIGLLKTELTQFVIEKDKEGKSVITGGWVWIISNDKLAGKDIMRPLEKIPEEMLKEFDKVQ